MDKKKVIELIKKGMLYQSKSSHVSSYKEKANKCFKEALDELQKTDWISVEDELPPYGEEVFVISKKGYKCASCRRFIYKKNFNPSLIDKNDFILSFDLFNDEIAHWCKIDKLEL